MATRSPLSACPDDILLLILEHCDKSSISNLSRASKALRSRCTPHMYREVDLSSHNIGRFPAHEDDKFRPEQWTHMDDYHRPENLLYLQRSFLRTMCECPHYANYVRSFSWTLVWYDQHEEDGLTEIDYYTWAVFSSMDAVEKLDLAAIPGDKTLDNYCREVPEVLFPRVTDLRFVGWFPHSLAVNIFNSINLSKLHSLRLDALQEEGQDSEGSPISDDFNKAHWDDEERSHQCKSLVEGSMPADVGTIFPGPMWIPFIPLIGKLTSLRCLEICVPPLEDSRMDEYCSDHLAYISVMAKLIRSVSPCLNELRIEYARGEAFHYGHYRGAFLQRMRFSDLILSSVFSSLSTDVSEWNSLQDVSLKGFLHEKDLIGDPSRLSVRQGRNDCLLNLQQMANTRTIQVRIDTFLSSKGGSLEWSDDSPRPSFLYMGYI